MTKDTLLQRFLTTLADSVQDMNDIPSDIDIEIEQAERLALAMGKRPRPYGHPFDFEEHVKIHIKYCEVLIEEDGTIYYAVPSHQEGLIAIACYKKNMTRKELNDSVPLDYYFNMLEWLTMETKVVAVWNEFYIGIPNEKQSKSLNDLRAAGIYLGTFE